MTNQEVFNEVQTIFRDVLDDQTININREMNFGDLEAWDSLSHINLLVALEKEFKCKFSLTEMAMLRNVGKILDLLEEKSK